MMPRSHSTPIRAAHFRRRTHQHLEMLYGPRADEVLRRPETLLTHQAPARSTPDTVPVPLWSQRDQ
ncbi:hypothetical protein [Halomonas almeriensis]|uniref:hypothetical protein n=1 Tax=Halomonas almeriensis TaxID=308163 RepID=UPI003F49449E